MQARLPPIDWKDDYRNYDVKSNLYYRSKNEAHGLRGFLIRIENKKYSPTEISFPGFVFVDTDDDSCKWVYVGNYQPETAENYQDDRVLPFCFQLPEKAKYVRPLSESDTRMGMLLLDDPSLRLGWQLATGKWVDLKQPELPTREFLLESFVERCLQMMARSFPEYALWKSLTEITFENRSRHNQQVVRSFLDLANTFISGHALPIHLPRIGGKPILCRWIEEVLIPLCDNWSRIQCPRCGCAASEPGTIIIEIARLTSAGTIKGTMKCQWCNKTDTDKDKVTLLTNCHNCENYPLIIGKNSVCKRCKGLVCDGQKDNKPCGSCQEKCTEVHTFS